MRSNESRPSRLSPGLPACLTIRYSLPGCLTIRYSRVACPMPAAAPYGPRTPRRLLRCSSVRPPGSGPPAGPGPGEQTVSHAPAPFHAGAGARSARRPRRVGATRLGRQGRRGGGGGGGEPHSLRGHSGLAPLSVLCLQGMQAGQRASPACIACQASAHVPRASTYPCIPLRCLHTRRHLRISRVHLAAHPYIPVHTRSAAYG